MDISYIAKREHPTQRRRNPQFTVEDMQNNAILASIKLIYPTAKFFEHRKSGLIVIRSNEKEPWALSDYLIMSIEGHEIARLIGVLIDGLYRSKAIIYRDNKYAYSLMIDSGEVIRLGESSAIIESNGLIHGIRNVSSDCLMDTNMNILCKGVAISYAGFHTDIHRVLDEDGKISLALHGIIMSDTRSNSVSVINKDKCPVILMQRIDESYAVFVPGIGLMNAADYFLTTSTEDYDRALRNGNLMWKLPVRY